MPSSARWFGGLVAAAAFAAAFAGVTAAPLAAQREVPDSIARRIDAVFGKYQRRDSPGCALGVYRNGRIVYDRGYGAANLELGVPIRPATVFDIGSTSKQFTAMSILLLARDGKLALDDDVRKFIPELPDYGPTITIRHLLHHTSGIRDYNTLLELAGERIENVSTDADGLDIIARQRALNFAPGTQWQYSNSGFFLLSIIVKRVSGQSLRGFAQTRIFGPLGMSHTHFHDDHAMVVPNRATGYIPADTAGPFRIEMSNWEQLGDGSVLTTVEDLVKWDQNFYSGVVGGPAVLAEMVKPGTLNGGKPLDYASGLFIGDYRGLKTVQHGGAWAGYRAQLLRFPSEHVSMACLCNLGSADPEGLARQVADVYLADRLGPAKDRTASRADTATGAGSPTLPPERLRAAIGTYRDPKLGGVARIVMADGKLALEYGGGSFELRPLSATEFGVADLDVRLQLLPAEPGRPRRVRLAGSDADRPTFEEIAPARPTSSALRDLVGEYASAELQTTYRIALEGGALVLHARNLPATPLEPTIRDEFEYPSYALTLHFTRRAGRVNGFTLTSGRTQGLRFDREGSARGR